MRVFIGVSEIANLVNSYRAGFEQLGWETYTVVARSNPLYPENRYDVVLLGPDGSAPASWTGRAARSLRARLRSCHCFLRGLRTCDLFIYNTGGSLLPAYLDYVLIRLLGKRLVVMFVGSEIRHWYAYQCEMDALGRTETVRPFIDAIRDQRYGSYRQMLRRIAAAERHAHLILSQPGHGQLQKRPYMRVNVALDLRRFRFNVPARETPLILHAPSSRGIKGTEYVLPAVERLRAEGLRFEFRLIERIAHTQLCELLSESDIVVDELFSDTVGVLSTEAMATGNAVLTSYMRDYARVPAGCPVVNVDKDSVTDELRRVILDVEVRRELARSGRRYVEQHHDAAKVAGQVLAWLEPGRITEYDFTPVFYRDFRMPAGIAGSDRERR